MSSVPRNFYILKCVYACTQKYDVPMKILGVFSSRKKARRTAKKLLESCGEDKMSGYMCGWTGDDYFAPEPAPDSDIFCDNNWLCAQCKACTSWKYRGHIDWERHIENMVSSDFPDLFPGAIAHRKIETPIRLCIQEIKPVS